MLRFIRAGEGTRLYLLLLTTPYALLWAQGANTGGLLMAALHALLILFYALSLDRVMLRDGMDPRLALTPEREAFIGAPVEAARVLALAGVIALSFAMLAVEPLLSLYAAAAALAMGLFVRTARGREGERRFVFAELWWTAGMLLAPMVLVGMRRWSELREGIDPDAGPGIQAGAVWATLLGALNLGLYVILCQIRDEAKDRTTGLATTATLFGRGMTTAVAFKWSLLAVLLAAWGVSRGWWGWGASAAVSCGALLSLYAVASGHERRAVRLWWTAASAAAVMIASFALRGSADAAPSAGEQISAPAMQPPPISGEARHDLLQHAARETGAGR